MSRVIRKIEAGLLIVVLLLSVCSPDASAADPDTWQTVAGQGSRIPMTNTEWFESGGTGGVGSTLSSMPVLLSASSSSNKMDTAYLKLSMMKYGKAIQASSLSGNVIVNVLENTTWQLTASFVRIEDGREQVTNVSDKCAWDYADHASAAIYMDKTGKLSIFRDDGRNHTVAAAYSCITEDGVQNYSAKLTFHIEHLTIKPADAEAALCLSLDYLAASQWSVLKTKAGSTVSSFAYYLRTEKGQDLPKIHNATLSYQNDASYSHLIADAAGSASVVGCYEDSGILRAALFTYRGKNYLVFAGSEKKSGENYARFYESSLKLYQKAVQNGNQVVTVGHGTAGSAAAYLSYMTGCQCVTFNAYSPMGNVYLNHFDVFCRHYSMSNKVNYILNDSGYNTVNYHTEPYYVVQRQYANSSSDGLSLLASMISYSVYNESVSFPKSSLSRSDFRTDTASKQTYFLGGDQNDVRRFRTTDISVMLGGDGSDTLEVYTNTATNIKRSVDFAGSVVGDLNTLGVFNQSQNLSAYISGMTIGAELAQGEYGAAATDYASFVAGLFPKGGVPAALISLPGQLERGGQMLSAGLYNPNHIVVGGKGNDTLTGTNNTDWYVYSYGDGIDTIYDGKGSANDGILLVGCENSSVTFNFDDAASGLLRIFIDGSLAINFYIESSGVRIHKGTSTRADKRVEIGAYSRSDLTAIAYLIKAIHEARCPVDMLIYDPSGNLALELQDGAECSKSTDFGLFSVTKVDDEYVKTAILLEENYTVRLRGTDGGTMRYTVARLNDNAAFIDYAAIDDIPVSKGEVFCASDNLTEAILTYDTDGDGEANGNISYDTTIQLSETALNFHLLEQTRLDATVTSHSVSRDFFWMSLDSDVAVVTEDGLVTAVGFGETRVCAVSLDGSQQYAVCTVTVPEESLSAEQFTVTGLESSYAYTGESITVSLDVSYHGSPLIENVDYTVSFSELLEPGEAVATITGIGMFFGSVSFSYEIAEPKEPETAEEKADWIAVECRREGVTDEYNIALWLHNWLIENANYDYTYTYYDPQGVLMLGTGVCQSYADAYAMLLDRFGIENQVVISPEMDHAWNLLKLEGEWCHVDCTWDDPGVGGAENHIYFGMDDTLIARDHVWPVSSYPASTSRANYYLLRSQNNVVENSEELVQYLTACAEEQKAEIGCFYIGEDPDFSIMENFLIWFAENNWKYGLSDYTIGGTKWMIQISMEYTEPWDEPFHYSGAEQSPYFTLRGPAGVYPLRNYNENGFVLIFGRVGCYNTMALLDKLHERTAELETQGVGVFVNIENTVKPDDFTDIRAEYPNFIYTYDDQILWSELMQLSGDSSQVLSYPFVFVFNQDGVLTHYSSDYVRDIDGLYREIGRVSTGKPLPAPEPVDPNYCGSLFNYTGDTAALKKCIVEQLAAKLPVAARDGTCADVEHWDCSLLVNAMMEILDEYRNVYQISDSYYYSPYYLSVQIPIDYTNVSEVDSSAIQSVVRDADTVHVSAISDCLDATVYCGIYSGDGQMISIQLSAANAKDLSFQFEGVEFQYVKVFLLSPDLVPLCECVTS